MRLIIITSALLLIMSGISAGAGKKISEIGNKHNFSTSNTDPSINFRASSIGDSTTYPRSSQICVFCHTPHKASGEGPLWNRKASTVSFFKHYSSATLAIDSITESEYGQPNGSSRLCLSCHDGVTALGAVFSTPLTSTSVNIQFTDVRKGQTSENVTLGYETFSSHHPVSFKYNDTVRNILRSAPYNKTEYWYSPPSSTEVKLDKLERMQCTTCHDPHQDKSDVPDPGTPLWTTTTYEKVCWTCHNLTPPSLPPNPWKN
jgi:hypothetical protein